MEDVAEGRLPVNNQIVYLLQDIFNLLPDLNGAVCLLGRCFALGAPEARLAVLAARFRSLAHMRHKIARTYAPPFTLPCITTCTNTVDELVRAFTVKTNDQMLAIYLASLIRATIALHDLISNKIVNREAERTSDTASFDKLKKVRSLRGMALGSGLGMERGRR